MNFPIIFLDFDGVLNQLGRVYGGRDPMKYIDAACVGRVNQLVKATKAKIVISSAWRTVYNLDVLRGILQVKGLEDPSVVIDKTPGWDDRPRGEEIAEYREMREHTGRYVILDDLPKKEFEGHWTHLINTDGKVGFTDRELETAIRILTLP